MPDLSKVTAILPNIADYVVYGAIAVVTLIGLFKCLIPLWRTTAALRRAITRLQENAGKQLDKPVWQEARFVGKRLKGSWLRFLQNAEQLDRRGLPTNVEDYINDDTVTHGPGNAGLAELIPSLLTFIRANWKKPFHESVSHDRGRTWEAARPARFAHPSPVSAAAWSSI